MKNVSNQYPFPWGFNPQMYYMSQNPFWFNQQMYNMYMNNLWGNAQVYNSDFDKMFTRLKDYGPEPFVIDIEEASKQNRTFRTALWTGEKLQVTLMSIQAGDDIGLEVHEDGDQFIRIERGRGIVQMGDSEGNLDFQRTISEDSAIMIPAGKWHNIINTGNLPLRLYAIYAPPEHPRDTVHETKADAEASERY